MIFIYCNSVFSRWWWSVELYKSRKETAIYKRRKNTQNNTKTQNTNMENKKQTKKKHTNISLVFRK